MMVCMCGAGSLNKMYDVLMGMQHLLGNKGSSGNATAISHKQYR